MSDRRQQVLDAIQRAAEPLGVSAIANRISVHPNTVRFHIEALVNDGIIERVPDTPSGPGRPRAGYRARPGLARGGARRHDPQPHARLRNRDQRPRVQHLGAVMRELRRFTMMQLRNQPRIGHESGVGGENTRHVLPELHLAGR